jgi:hypothetical protein
VSSTSANHSQQIISKLWNYSNILRDDSPFHGDYVEQLTYLLLLKRVPPLDNGTLAARSTRNQCFRPR